MTCERCGSANSDEARFCQACGSDLHNSDSSGDTTVASDGSGPKGASPERSAWVGAAASVPEALRHLLSGSYEIERLLGRGGMGAVYLAREIALDRLVAIKLLPFDLAAEETSVERFLQEARVAARLRHPNIVAIHTVGGSGGVNYFTMDYIDGETLEKWDERRGPLSPEEIDRIFLDVCRAVEHAHRLGVVHRDLKPSNVMLDSRGHVFVMDFGLARAMESSGITQNHAVVGTPRYLSPEQIGGRPASPRSDIYALGLVYYFLLTGEHLVTADSLPSIVAQHLAGSFLPKVESDPRIPDRLRPLILEMLSREKEQRPRSVSEIVAGLAASRDAKSTAPPLPRAPAGSAPPKSKEPSMPARVQARERMRQLLDRLEHEKKK